MADPRLRAGAVAGALWLTGYAVATGIVAGNERAQMLLGDLVYLVPLVAATALALLAAVRLSGRTRLFWLIVGVSLVLLLSGECTWSFRARSSSAWRTGPCTKPSGAAATRW